MTSAWISERAQRGRGVGRKIGIRSAGREDHDAAFFQMADGPAADVRLGHLVHLDGGHHARGDARLFERVLQRQGVDHRGQHAHVVGRDAVHVLRRRGHAAEEIAAAHHQSDLDAGLGHFGDFGRQAFHSLRIDAERAAAGQHLAAQLEKDALVFRHGRRHAFTRA